eukprot:scaffold13361_cov78-Cyclotella_meneghiniana.AAC.6
MVMVALRNKKRNDDDDCSKSKALISYGYGHRELPTPSTRNKDFMLLKTVVENGDKGKGRQSENFRPF